MEHFFHAFAISMLAVMATQLFFVSSKVAEVTRQLGKIADLLERSNR